MTAAKFSPEDQAIRMTLQTKPTVKPSPVPQADTRKKFD